VTRQWCRHPRGLAHRRQELQHSPNRPTSLSPTGQLHCRRTDAIDQRQPTWSEQTPAGRWRCYELEDLLARDKISHDLFWLKDESLLDSDNLPEPDVIPSEIAEDLRSVLEQMEEMLGDLELSSVAPEGESGLVEAG